MHEVVDSLSFDEQFASISIVNCVQCGAVEIVCANSSRLE